MKWTNEIILEFLHLYEKEPAIWDPRHLSHKDRFAIADAWRRIQDNLSVPCLVEELKRKKDSLMATFRSLTNKVKASMDNYQGGDDVYRPNWFAYDCMSRFLDGIYQPRAFVKEDTDDNRIYEIDQRDRDSESPLIEDGTENDDDSKHSFPETVNIFKPPPERRIRKRREMMRTDVSNCSCEPDRDECSLFTQLLATKLRSFDDHTRDILMHEIDNLVFRTKMRKRQKLHISASNSNTESVHDDYYGPASLVDNTLNYCEPICEDSPESGVCSTSNPSESYSNVVVKTEM
nr:uncharacterized protein LOC111516157 [Leptinotarsa decemlineata]